MSSFFVDDKEQVRYRGRFKRDKLPAPWDDVCVVLMKYLTLEGRFGVYYYYHFLLLNHFRNRDFISILFFLLHSLEDMVTDVREKRNKGQNFTIIHQGLIFRLYQYHLALFPLGWWWLTTNTTARIHPRAPVLALKFIPPIPPLARKTRKRKNLIQL